MKRLSRKSHVWSEVIDGVLSSPGTYAVSAFDDSRTRKLFLVMLPGAVFQAVNERAS